MEIGKMGTWECLPLVLVLMRFFLFGRGSLGGFSGDNEIPIFCVKGSCIMYALPSSEVLGASTRVREAE